MKISIVLPAKDEESLLEMTANDIVSYVRKKRVSYQLLIVENGSTDDTYKIAKKLASKNKNIIVARLLEASYGKALIKGISEAKGEYVVIFNVDHWDGKFIDAAKRNLDSNDVLVGSKNLSTSKDKRPILRRLTTKAFNY